MQCCKIYNKKLWENARNCNWTVETAVVWTTTRQKKATETVHVIQHCQRTGGSATQGHSEKNSWKSLLKIWHYESKHWFFEILVFSTNYTDWNSLQENAVTAPSVQWFKERLRLCRHQQSAWDSTSARSTSSIYAWIQPCWSNWTETETEWIIIFRY